MAVFSFRTMDILTGGVRNIASRIIDPSNLVITGKEFIEAFIRPDHIPILNQTRELVGSVGAYYCQPKLTTTTGIQYQLLCQFGYNKPPTIIPGYVNEGFYDDQPLPSRAKILAWLQERERLGNMFGDAIDAMHWLNDHCGNAGAVAVMFPALPTVLKAGGGMDEKVGKRAAKIAESKSFGNLPKLPLEVKRRISEVSDFVLTCSILEPGSLAAAKKTEACFAFHSITSKFRPDFIAQATGGTKSGTFI